MDLKAKKNFSSNLVGNVVAGQILPNVSAHYAAHLCDYGLAEPVGGGLETAGPLSGGTGQPSSSSQAGQASKRGNVITSASVSAPAPAVSSESTRPQSSTDQSTPSTRTTADGGNATKKRRTRKRKE